MHWLLISILASVVLTVVLNVAIRLFPGASDRNARRLGEWADRQPASTVHGGGRGDGPQVRVIVPWKAMLIASLGLTVALNLAIRLF